MRDPAELTAALRERGMRATRQREQVLAEIHRLGHATPEQLASGLAGVDVATVYRNLEVLEELGFVSHAHFGHGAPSYRPAHDDHVHLVCHACGSVVDEDAGIVAELAEQLRRGRGFEVDVDHFTVFGRCAACAAAEPPAGSMPEPVPSEPVPVDPARRTPGEQSAAPTR